LPIELKPVQVRGSLYILIPKTITQLFNISKNTTFILSVREHKSKLILVFRAQRSNESSKGLGLEPEKHLNKRDLF
jgi:hypothetical protein